MFSAKYLCLHREKKEKKNVLYPISEAISGGNFASRAAWNVFSAYRAMSPVVRVLCVQNQEGGGTLSCNWISKQISKLKSRSQSTHTPTLVPQWRGRFSTRTHTPLAGQLLPLGKGRGHQGLSSSRLLSRQGVGEERRFAFLNMQSIYRTGGG